MKSHLAVALLITLTLSVVSPVTYAPSSQHSQAVIINIDICHAGKAFTAGEETPAILPQATALFVQDVKFEIPFALVALPTFEPSVSKPPPKLSV